jgi:hypothetical protein
MNIDIVERRRVECRHPAEGWDPWTTIPALQPSSQVSVFVDERPSYGLCPGSVTPANSGNIICQSAMDPRFRGDDGLQRDDVQHDGVHPRSIARKWARRGRIRALRVTTNSARRIVPSETRTDPARGPRRNRGPLRCVVNVVIAHNVKKNKKGSHVGALSFLQPDLAIRDYAVAVSVCC